MKKGMAVLLVLCVLMIGLTGCEEKTVSEEKGTAATGQNTAFDAYLTSVQEQSAAIKTSLEKDDLTQTEMNLKSEELLALWDAAMNRVLEEAEKVLPEEKMDVLISAQNAWLPTRDEAAEAAGKEVEGGSMYALVVNCAAAASTEARVYALYEMLK